MYKISINSKNFFSFSVVFILHSIYFLVIFWLDNASRSEVTTKTYVFERVTEWTRSLIE